MLMQVAATMPHAPWSLLTVIGILTPFALLALSWMQARASDDRREIRADVKENGLAIASVRNDVTTLETHVGIDGNGIIAKLDSMAVTLDEIKNELAENRGAHRHIRPGT